MVRIGMKSDGSAKCEDVFPAAAEEGGTLPNDANWKHPPHALRSRLPAASLLPLINRNYP